MRRMTPLLSAAILALLLSGCGSASNKNGATDAPKAFPSAGSSLGIETTVNTGSESPAPTELVPSNTQTPDSSNVPDAKLETVAREVVEYLRERDLTSLTPLIDSELGLRFSPYPHINTQTDLVFQADALPDFKDTTKQLWGTYDGRGDPIELSFRDYFEQFVYNKDFGNAPNVSFNKIISKGNIVFNGTEAYPGASFVEFHYPGFDKSLEGTDWQSLILVFVSKNDEWKLAAIAHGQWAV
ncbi:hypothetical protein [Cohnella mopanensis]|uniref:hypothetical protein n=1 Tax=Cohnella mopanensis TaxID=2911966 RepID=UPI001EF97876|nr:hypothetical protein [Cohnella mopanensis]